MAGGRHDALREETEGTEVTDSQEERRNGDERSLNHEGHEDHEEVRPFDWPPKAACRDVAERKYKPHCQSIGGLYLRSLTSRLSACFARRPIERPLLRSSSVCFVPPVNLFFVSFVTFVFLVVNLT